MIRDICDDELDALANRIRPLMRFSQLGKRLEPDPDSGDLYLVRMGRGDYRAKNLLTAEVIKRLEVPLAQIMHFKCYHEGKVLIPTLAEVLAQIPDWYLSITDYFEIDQYNDHEMMIVDGVWYCITTIRLYTKQ